MAGCLDTAFDIEPVGTLLHPDVDTVAVIFEPVFGILDIKSRHRKHLEPPLGGAVSDGHGHRDGQPNHARAGDADAHGVLEDILAQAQADARRLGAQDAAGFGHAEGHGTGLGTASGQHHLLLKKLLQLIAYFLFHIIDY